MILLPVVFINEESEDEGLFLLFFFFSIFWGGGSCENYWLGRWALAFVFVLGRLVVPSLPLVSPVILFLLGSGSIESDIFCFSDLIS